MKSDRQDWPPPVFAQRQGEWAHLQARRSGLHQEQLDRIDRDRSIHPAVLPQAGDYVIATGDQLHDLCRERGILYLIYVGFATNICVPDRDYGMRAMRERGYALVLLRCHHRRRGGDTYRRAATSVMIHQFELRDVAGTIRRMRSWPPWMECRVGSRPAFDRLRPNGLWRCYDRMLVVCPSHYRRFMPNVRLCSSNAPMIVKHRVEWLPFNSI